MGKYLALLNGGATDQERQEFTAEESAAVLVRWGEWAAGLGAALIDPGAPLYRKVRLNAGTAAPFEDGKTGYAIVSAASLDQAVDMFADHPHLGLAPGNSIEVLECPAPPT